jgi:hypothetical protein
MVEARPEPREQGAHPVTTESSQLPGRLRALPWARGPHAIQVLTTEGIAEDQLASR